MLKSKNLSAYWNGEGNKQQNNSTSRVAIKTSSTWRRRGRRDLFSKKRTGLVFQVRPHLPAKNRQNTHPAHIFPNSGTQHIIPLSRDGRTCRKVLGMLLGGVAVLLFVSTLIDPDQPKHTHLHTHTHTPFLFLCNLLMTQL